MGFMQTHTTVGNTIQPLTLDLWVLRTVLHRLDWLDLEAGKPGEITQVPVSSPRDRDYTTSTFCAGKFGSRPSSSNVTQKLAYLRWTVGAIPASNFTHRNFSCANLSFLQCISPVQNLRAFI